MPKLSNPLSMKHPNPKIQKKQDDFLTKCPENEREVHARIFRLGNATIYYHQLAAATNDETLQLYFQEWLEELPVHIRMDMEKKGLENCKSMLPFTRYVNERSDIGMDEWMKEHLSEEDYTYYKKA